MSILNKNISCFANYRTSDNPKCVNMLQWLKSAKYADKVEAICSIEDKAERDKIKATLPAITPSGIFSYRDQNKLIQHSGLIQFDIDKKDNEHISNFDQLKNHIKNIPNVAYVGLSASGRGYWGIIPIKYPEKHKEHFRAIHNSFKKYGLHIDTAPQNEASLRGYSYDPDGYFNHEAKVFEYLDQPKEKKPVKTYHFNNGSDTTGKVEKHINEITSTRTDITAGYETWRDLGFALSDEFGESGREYYHAVSQYHPEYDERKTDDQFTHCLRSGGQGVTIASFFHHCRLAGIQLNTGKGKPHPNKDRKPQPKYESHIQLNNEGYPVILETPPLTPDDPEYDRSTRIALSDCDNELERAKILDPILNTIIETFNCEIENAL